MSIPPRMEQPSALVRFLNLFTEVRPGEAASSVLLALNVYLILSAYYVLKPVREALILAGGGAELKSYAAAGQAVLLLLILPIYSWLASNVSGRLLINSVTLFFAACLLTFYTLAQWQVPLGVVFFLWVGIFNLMVPAQFWAFANDIYDPDTGKRLFVIVAFGASLGAVSGSYLDRLLLGHVGVYQLMLVAAGILVLSLLITNLVAAREKLWQRPATVSTSRPGEPAVAEDSIGQGGAFALVFHNRYLLLIALLMLVLNWVNTTGEYILGRTVLETALAASADGQVSTEQFIGEFYASFYTVVNIAGLLLQLFVVSRVLKYLGVRAAIMLLPLIALGGYILVAMFPLLSLVRWVKTAENATDYSVQNTVRQILFLPTTREEKYKAKQVTDTLFVRAGDVLSALVVYVGSSWLALSIAGFALFNTILVACWLLLAYSIGSHYRRLAPATEDKESTA
ncbi:NTP/NDP exchange transporter [Haliea sp. E17]|uniref:NTP/NDP exchange transporter n=1 Tax=Haliea sp. E17 TaxID=3401576 RepID=UPI003AACFACC